MNNDEIVRALKRGCIGCDPMGCCEYEAIGPAAADLIESLQAQLAEAQRRERVAAEALKGFVNCSGCGGFGEDARCTCESSPFCGLIVENNDHCGYGWRCAQESGDGAGRMKTVKEIKMDIAACIQNFNTQRIFDAYRAELTAGIPIDRLEMICDAEKNGKGE